MVLLQKMVDELDGLLRVPGTKDYCPNGLQVQGKPEVRKCISGVTACQALIDEAIAQKADAILVHHGLFWKGDSPVIVGPLYRRLRALMQHEISLIAYHLPLDIHPTLGNNACLARMLQMENVTTFKLLGVDDLGWIGSTPSPISGEDLNQKLASVFHRSPLHIPASKPISKVAWCTGAAQDGISEAVAHGADAYITGEVSERTVHIARELGVHFFAAGHHATERYGIKSLGEYISEHYSVDVSFVDIDNPV